MLRLLGPAALCLASASWLACGASPSAPTKVAPKGGDSGEPVAMLTPSRLVPELDAHEIEPEFREEGVDKILIAGLRILAFDDGRVERAEQRFPPGVVQACLLYTSPSPRDS